jgi:hypothetical protein
MRFVNYDERSPEVFRGTAALAGKFGYIAMTCARPTNDRPGIEVRGAISHNRSWKPTVSAA